MYKNILFIDDDKATNFFNRKIAQNYGKFSTIEIVQSGMEGIDFLKNCGSAGKTKPDLIFLDINMPAMNGWEFLNSFKELDQAVKLDIEIVLLSTSKESEDIEKFKNDDNLVEFIKKPLTQDKIDSLCHKRFNYTII